MKRLENPLIEALLIILNEFLRAALNTLQKMHEGDDKKC